MKGRPPNPLKGRDRPEFTTYEKDCAMQKISDPDNKIKLTEPRAAAVE
jgi:hypothetical protein